MEIIEWCFSPIRIKNNFINPKFLFMEYFRSLNFDLSALIHVDTLSITILDDLVQTGQRLV